MDIIRGRRGEENHCSLEILGFTPSTGRDSTHYCSRTLGVIPQGFCVVSIDISRCNGIDVDPPPSPLVGQSLGKLHHSTLAGRVSGYSYAALKG